MARDGGRGCSKADGAAPSCRLARGRSAAPRGAHHLHDRRVPLRTGDARARRCRRTRLGGCMPSTLTFPGVYIEEVPSGVRTITGVATSITAFVGYARRGPVNEPTIVQSFADFSRLFGGLSPKSTMSQAVQQYFLNGGRDALIVRVVQV